MLKYLKIKNIALVRDLAIEFGQGLVLLTGETGAGKSILIDALGLLLGERASADLVRTGEGSAVVEAVFDAPGLGSALERRGLPADDDEVVIRREVMSSGKGRATINGALAPVSVLRELGPELASIHGQHEPLGLTDPATHLGILDRHAGLEAAVSALADPYGRFRRAEAALAALAGGRREAERRRETLEHQLREIERAALVPGEEEALRTEKVVQANADRLAALSQEAYAVLYEDEGAILGRLAQVYRRVEELAAIDTAAVPFLSGRNQLRAELDELALFLRDYRDRLRTEPGRLDSIESRLALIERLKRRYGATAEEVLAFADRCRAELADLASPEEQERQWEARRSDAWAAYLTAAVDVSGRRRKAARNLQGRVERELGELAMDKTRFEVRLAGGPETASPERATERGLDSVEFLLSPNPGEELRPLARIASGGELSRIMLALKTAVALEDGKTVVFDEVDAGIGGRVAEVVGRKLRALALRRQILCVTHLPQIAAFADEHHAVRKRVEGGRTLTEVQLLDDEARVEEVARMLGGETVTEAARRHAGEMVRQSRRPA